MKGFAHLFVFFIQKMLIYFRFWARFPLKTKYIFVGKFGKGHKIEVHV